MMRGAIEARDTVDIDFVNVGLAVDSKLLASHISPPL